jgi:glycosyltransferase involved in cell wall biosynthesis
VSPGPSVTIAIPVLNEGAHIDRCLASIEAQTYPNVTEVLVVDGGSDDDTRERARRHTHVRVLDNPRRMQAPALNVALAEATGEIFVRVDGHSELQADYVSGCVDALERTGAALVGGAMVPQADGVIPRAIAVAMASRLGAGPAYFHIGAESRWVDTVYLGAGRTATLREVGGYAENVGVNEDAELAWRLREHGGIWFDAAIRSTYVPRAGLRPLARQFFRYGRSRCATIRRHPDSLAPRQLVAPALVLGLLTPARREVAAAYAAVVLGRAAVEALQDAKVAAAMTAVLPTMHLAWGSGFLAGFVLGPPRPPAERVGTSH